MRSTQLIRAMGGRALRAKSSTRSAHQITLNEVSRDKYQGGFANRVPLSDPMLLRVFALWDRLNRVGAPIFGCIEKGGASVQVAEVYTRLDHTEISRKMRQAAPHSTIRPLWRGANSFLLKPAHRSDLQWLLQQVAHDVASVQFGAERELLRVKVFDSQAQLGEVLSTIEMVRELQDAGHGVSVEIAIPYSDGRGRADVNPYPNDYFVKKMIEAAAMAHDVGLPKHRIFVSLKDMVGELNPSTSQEILGATFEGLQRRGFNTEIGLHCHDTGLALEAYMAAARTASLFGWRINLDTVEGDASGFVNTSMLIDRLMAEGLIESISPEQKQILAEMGRLQNEISHRYRSARAREVFTGEDLRHYAIPGGGGASFIKAVEQGKFHETLNLPLNDALHVMATALIAVGRLMGHAFPVTPGFQNKQLAAFTLVGNMLAHHQLPSGNKEKIVERLLQPMTDEEVAKLFLPGQRAEVKEFLRGEMPAEVHPIVRKALGRREGLLTDNIPSLLPAAKALVEKVHGRVDHSSVTRALILGLGDYESAMRDPNYNKELDHTKFDTPQEWAHAMSRLSVIRDALTRSGLSPVEANAAARKAVFAERYYYGTQPSPSPESWHVLHK